MKPFAPLAFAAFALAACNAPAPQASPPPAPGSEVFTPPGFRLPQGAGCSADIARYRAVLSNDLAMGNVAQSVFNQIRRETDAAATACSAGHEAQAKSMLAASKQRHGYPADI